MKKILYIFFLTTLLLSACKKEEEFPQKYASFFPYEEDTWQERQFQTPHGVETLCMQIRLEKYIDKYLGFDSYDIYYNAEGWFKQNDTLSQLKIYHCFQFLKTGAIDIGILPEYTYSPKWPNCHINNDTLFEGTFMKFVRNKGLVNIKWPKKENFSISDVNKYPNTPWGETWTLIE